MRPNPKLITPIKSKNQVSCSRRSNSTIPITIPIVPVVKNTIIKTFALKGWMYFITDNKIQHYYKLTVVEKFLIENHLAGNTLNLQKFHCTSCQCSSAWLEHSPCKRKVMGSDPIIGFIKFSYWHSYSH